MLDRAQDREEAKYFCRLRDSAFDLVGMYRQRGNVEKAEEYLKVAMLAQRSIKEVLKRHNERMIRLNAVCS